MSVLAPVPSKEEYEKVLVNTAVRVRELAVHYLMPDKSEFEVKGINGPEYARKMANATAAVEVVCSLVNSFGVMAGFQNYSSQIAITDLVFVLNTNTFWVQNASYLVPLMNSAVNSFVDAQELRLKGEPLWKDLEYHNNNVWLELLPAVVFCLKGYPEMRKISLEMKKAFEMLLRRA
jgi:hypothetical protein